MKEQITQIVLNGIKVINQNLDKPLPVEDTSQCPIYGTSDGIDSISLVALISVIEESIENEMNKSIILADEKAMSRRNSPFLNVNTLVEYINQLINKEI